MPYPIAQLLRHGPEMEAWFVKMDAMSRLHRRIVLKKMRASGKLALPRFLYRFQSLRRTPNRKSEDPPFAADSLDRLRVPLLESLLALRSPEAFIDPFDMGADIQIGGTEYDKVIRYRDLFERQNPSGKLSEREAFVARMLGTPREKLLSQIASSYCNARN